MSEAEDDQRTITARLLAAREGHAQSALFREVLDTLPDSVVLVDHDGRIAYVNRQGALMFGYSRTEMTGQPHAILVPETQRGAHDGHRAAYQRDPHIRPMGAPGLSLMGRRKNGEIFPVDIMLAPIVVEQGIYTVAVIRRPASNSPGAADPAAADPAAADPAADHPAI